MDAGCAMWMRVSLCWNKERRVSERRNYGSMGCAASRRLGKRQVKIAAGNMMPCVLRPEAWAGARRARLARTSFRLMRQSTPKFWRRSDQSAHRTDRHQYRNPLAGWGNVGVGFGVPIDMARKVMDQLATAGRVKVAVVAFQTIDKKRRAAKVRENGRRKK